MNNQEALLIKKKLLIAGAIAASIFFVLIFTSCTISFSNISTHGTATDLVDETQTNTPNISPNIEIPVKPI